MHDETGSGPAATVMVMGAALLSASTVLLGISALFIYESAQSATEQAALEAADAATGRIAGFPCDLAQRRAEASSLEFGSCELDGLVSRVTFQVTVLGFSITTRAKAGPQNSLE